MYVPVNRTARQIVFFLLLLNVETVRAWAVEREDEPTPRTARSVTIVTLGDSITKGVRSGVTAEQTFAGQLELQLQQQAVAAKVINVGVGGERTDQALKRLDKIIQLQPDIVTVMYGTNDSYVDQGRSASRITLEEYRGNLVEIVTELLRRGIVPVLMTEPRWADDVRTNGVGENPNVKLEPYVVACREVARQWRVPLVDHFSRWTKLREQGQDLRQLTTDGCHPNPAGHQELTSLIAPVMRRTIGPTLNTRRTFLAGDKPLRLVCFGDSVTGVYYHTGSRRAYTDMLGIALRRSAPQRQVEMINAGISGHTTANALARIDRDVLSHQPDLVTVMFGLNDMTRVPLGEYRENLREIVTRCRAAGSEVILATPNNVTGTDARPTEKLIAYCDVVRDLGNELNAPVCDVYREFAAARAHDAFQWRLLMSDAIHPNMEGHRRIATMLAQTVTGNRISLADVLPPQPALAHTRQLLRDGKPVRVLAMPPYDRWAKAALLASHPEADIDVTSWVVESTPLAEIEQEAKARVRQMKPDLVVIAVPRSAGAATEDEDFAHAFSWIMNWSLNFGPPTWDCVVVHASVAEPASRLGNRDDLVRRLVRAQDLPLIDRPPESQADADAIFGGWIKQSLARTNH